MPEPRFDLTLHHDGEPIRFECGPYHRGVSPGEGYLTLCIGRHRLCLHGVTPATLYNLAQQILRCKGELADELAAQKQDRNDHELLDSLGVDTDVGAFEVTASIPHPEQPCQHEYQSDFTDEGRAVYVCVKCGRPTDKKPATAEMPF